MFYENYVRLCNSVNKTPSAVALELGIQKSTVSRWRNGCEPRDATLLKVADYFRVSVAELTGEKEKSPAPNGAELDEEIIMRLCQLTPDEIQKVDAFVQGLLVSR